MKVLVTGGAGFIGSHFIEHMLSEYPECSIVNLDALTHAGDRSSLQSLEGGRYRFVQGDIRDSALVEELISQCDAIVHFAAESHVDRSIKDPILFVKTNVEGTAVLLDAARKHNKRFHHVSTDEVFGQLEANDTPFEEATPYDPRSPYSASKAASDHLVRAYFHTYGLPITISNCSNNYGPRQFVESFIPVSITNLINGKKIPIYGDGKQVRDWLYVVDHCRAIALILEKGKIGETYCIGGSAERQNLEVARTILSLAGKDEDSIEYVTDRPGHDRRYAISYAKLAQELGWAPEVTFEEGIKKTVDWYVENRSWWERKKRDNGAQIK
jgi:dTDP-glucose 4,6-dehydratase